MEAPPRVRFRPGDDTAELQHDPGSEPSATRSRPAAEERSRDYRRLSLYTRVLLVNAGVLVAATALLSFTPARVPFPTGVEEALLLVAGLGVMVIANAALLRLSFGPLSRLVQLMRTIDLLKPGQRLQVAGGVEVRAVIRGFNEMLERLEDERLASSRRALSAQEDERRRIGQELHDEISQRLTGMLLQLKRVAEASPAGLRADVLEVQEEVRSTLDEVGRIAWQLRPGILDDLGLARALESLAGIVAERSAVQVVQRIDAQVPRLSSDAELAVYRIAQESLTNAVRHGRPSRIEISLRLVPGAARLRVADDGNGLVEDEMTSSGIRGMRERALQIGADLQIDAAAGRGVAVVLDVPLAEDGD